MFLPRTSAGSGASRTIRASESKEVTVMLRPDYQEGPATQRDTNTLHQLTSLEMRRNNVPRSKRSMQGAEQSILTVWARA